MKKLLLFLALLLSIMLCGAALAETMPVTPTPAPTQVPEMIAQPDATRRPIATATPRPADAPLPEDVFIGNAVEIARRMDMLAKSGVFYTYCNRSYASEELWDATTRGDHTTPVRIYSLSGDALVAALTAGAPEGSSLLDLTRTDLRRDLVSSLPDMMFIGRDSEEVSLIQGLGRYKVFAADIPEGCGILVLQYEDAVPIVCYWYTDRGAVSISAFFLPDETLAACACPEDVAAWFQTLGLPTAAFEEVEWQ